MFRYENDGKDKENETAVSPSDSPDRRVLIYWSFAGLVFTLYVAASLIIRESFTDLIDDRGINSDLLLLAAFVGAVITVIKATTIWLPRGTNEMSPNDDV